MVLVDTVKCILQRVFVRARVKIAAALQLRPVVVMFRGTSEVIAIISFRICRARGVVREEKIKAAALSQ